jgi:hypothetical protein
VHPLRQGRLRFVEGLRSPNRLSACSTCIAGCGTTLASQLQFQFRKTCQYAGHHSASRVRGIDALTKGTKHDPTLAKFTDGRHDLSGVAAQAVDANNDDGVAFSRVSQKSGKARTLFPRGSARQLVAIDAGRVNARCGKRVELLV